MAEVYTSKADRARLARSAAERIANKFFAAPAPKQIDEPGKRGKNRYLKIRWRPLQDDDLRYVEFGPADGRGYPTNFLKYGKENCYHVYRVVGLKLLALSPGVDEAEKKTLIHWTLRWLDDLRAIEAKGKLQFHPPQDMLDDINKNQSITRFTDFEHLLATAQAAIE